jgi:hypothetical protein
MTKFVIALTNFVVYYGENPPNLGLATRQSLDTLKDKKYSILPQTKHNLTIIKGREIR